MVLLVPIGLGTKIYEGPGQALIQAHVGGVAYVTFFALFGLALWPRAGAFVVSIAAFLGTCAVEVLQLWHPPWLDAIRATRPGGLLLGSTFSIDDFAWYALGGIVGYGWLRLITLLRRPK